jgi:uncharacterized protein (DUF305 family)
MISRTFKSAALLALLLTACGTSQQTAAPTSATTAPTAVAAPATTAPTADAMHGGGHDAGTESDNAPYDVRFIDSMIMHHQGAIDMANQALKEAEHTEIKTLAEDIIKAQEAEITQMQQWREQWYPALAPTAGMSMDVGDMQISTDTGIPFDQRFITAMIAHHQGAIAMAKDAQQQAEHVEIKTLAQNIITAQEAEITQMQQWQQAWFG